MKVMPSLLVTQMKNSAMDSQQHDVEFKKMPCVEWIPFAVVMLVTT